MRRLVLVLLLLLAVPHAQAQEAPRVVYLPSVRHGNGTWLCLPAPPPMPGDCWRPPPGWCGGEPDPPCTPPLVGHSKAPAGEAGARGVGWDGARRA